MGLINHLAKACFVQGLSNDRIQTIVRAKGETTLLSACIDSALEEESAILSVKERGFAAPKSNDKRVFEGSGRGSWVRNLRSENGGFAARQNNERSVFRGSGKGSWVNNPRKSASSAIRTRVWIW
jgi:hypothetical protein